MDYLNFSEISKIPFEKVLNHLGVAYTESDNSLRGEGFIVSRAKNLYFNPKGSDKGSVINFLAYVKGTDLRTAATELKKAFLEEEAKKEIPEYELHYCKWLEQAGISEDLAEDFECGLVKSRGIMAGKVALKIKDSAGRKVAYIGRNINPEAQNDWFFFKGYKNDHIYNIWRVSVESEVILTTSPFAVMKIHSFGYTNVLGLLSSNMTEAQENLLKRFYHILLLHPNPQNIQQRLSHWAYVKAPQIDDPEKLTKDDITILI